MKEYRCINCKGVLYWNDMRDTFCPHCDRLMEVEPLPPKTEK